MRFFRGVLFALLFEVIALALALAVCEVARADTAVVWDNRPEYGRPIVVIDVVMGSLPFEDRKAWRTYRDRAFENWGLDFELRRMPEVFPLDDAHVAELGQCAYITPGVITMWPARFEPYPVNSGGYVEDCTGGIAMYDPRPRYWSAGLIGHELGHALGLGHTTTGIMGGGGRPNEAELFEVGCYYGAA